MKLIVNQMPKTKRECPFSERHHDPKCGYVCKMDGKMCTLGEDHPVICVSCRWLKIQ